MPPLDCVRPDRLRSGRETPGQISLGQRWRTLLEDPAAAAHAFPSLAGAMAQPAERRRILKLMAASLALSGCDPAPPGSEWVPAVTAPPDVVPGLPNHYATATLSGGTALGLVVTHASGRPIKVEGNPLHPASLGATDAPAQALILDFYDPDRAGGLLRQGAPSTDGALRAALLPLRARLDAARGAGLRVLTGTVMSPTLGRLLDNLLRRWPEAACHQWDASAQDAALEGARLAYGRPLALLPRPAAADVVLALDSDLACAAPGWVRHARDLAARRNPVLGPPSRIHAAEAVPSAIGTLADHRHVAGPAAMHAALLALRAGLLGGDAPDVPPWVAAALASLRAAPGRALIHAGPHLPPEAHALIHAMNEALGGRGRTFDLIESPGHRPENHAASLQTLLDSMHAGRTEALLILDANPVHTAPGFADALHRVPFVLHAGPTPDETARAATWHLPLAHEFEAWGDLRAHDGTATVQQPQSLPLHAGRSLPAVLATLLGSPPPDPLQAVRDTWWDVLPAEDAWADALADGVLPGTAHAPSAAPLRPAAAQAAPPAPPSRPLTLLFRPDPYLGDGRRANNAWLQELPRPLTKHTWENPLLVSPALARQHGLSDGDVVRLAAGDQAVELPAAVLPGLAPDCAVATLGFGRAAPGQVGAGAGWDLFPLRTATAIPALRRTGRRHPLAATDRGGGWAEHAEILRTVASLAPQPPAPDASLYQVRPPGPVAWGMSVDLNACIGCNACVAACTAENNVPVVGRENVLRGREMHWLRIDRYWEGTLDTATAAFQPMLCMHCEAAPCETVCPVSASVHDGEGLNVQVYNRCIGTRFCSNNCPYKVRRFNFGPYAQDEHRPAAARNPDVTVRARGVMEKCTFCVQRIAEARIRHDRDGTPEQAVTACQAACPTSVFTFGDLNDPGSGVRRRKGSPLTYVLLPEQQTRPRVTYEARVRPA